MIQQGVMLSAIGTDQHHFPVVLAAADSTLEGMLSLNVNVVEEGAGASSSQLEPVLRAGDVVGGAGAVHHDDMRSSVKSQASGVLSTYMYTCSAIALERRPVAVLGRNR